MSDDFQIILQPEAAIGMESAYNWIEKDSPQRARKWMKGLMAAIESLKVFPRRCALAPENEVFDEEIRQHLYGSRNGVYRILFTIQEDTVNVLYIRHSSQQRVTPDTSLENADE
ncbi:MAG: plasmid stabilization system protein [Chthonomonadaceae bacterium]|nr:plasmid stabilization system protein [Chthonomonadaceae bacterium]